MKKEEMSATPTFSLLEGWVAWGKAIKQIKQNKKG